MTGELPRGENVARSGVHTSAKKQKKGLKERAVHEGKRLFAMFLYLFILFGLFNLHEYIVLAQHQIEFTHFGYGLINAWIFAKVMLVAEDLRLGKGLENRPLIYPVLLKAGLFTIVFIVFRVLEELLVVLWKGKPISESIPVIGGGGLEGIASVALIVAFALIPYFAYREVARVIGENELRSLIFRRRGNTDVFQPTAPG